MKWKGEKKKFEKNLSKRGCKPWNYRKAKLFDPVWSVWKCFQVFETSLGFIKWTSIVFVVWEEITIIVHSAGSSFFDDVLCFLARVLLLQGLALNTHPTFLCNVDLALNALHFQTCFVPTFSTVKPDVKTFQLASLKVRMDSIALLRANELVPVALVCDALDGNCTANRTQYEIR